MKIYCFDIEARGFVEDISSREDIHIIHLRNQLTGVVSRFFDDYEDRIEPKVHLGDFEANKAGNLEEGVKELLSADCMIIQNGSGYDFHVFEVAFPELMGDVDYFARTTNSKFPYRVMDTYVMSCTLNPERKPPKEAYLIKRGDVGAHSIEAHGIRMGRYKPEHEDWSQLTLDMLHRCAEDVEIGADYYRFLMDEWHEQASTPNKVTGMSIADAYYCELRVAFSIARQALRGFPLDVGFISECLSKWDAEMDAIEQSVQPFLPYKVLKSKADYSESQKAKLHENLNEKAAAEVMAVSHCSKFATVWNLTIAAKKSGTPIAASVKKHFPEMVGYKEDYGNEFSKAIVGGAYTPVEFEQFSIGNREAVKQLLFSKGWLGVNFNDSEVEHMEAYEKLKAGGKADKALAEAMGELPNPWSGKIDDKSIEAWLERAEVEGYTVPEWAIGIASWYIIASRRTQACNRGDLAKYSKDGVWSKKDGKDQCRGFLMASVCQETGMTAKEYFEKYKMLPDTGHWRTPARAFTAATNTFRMRHRNVVNIPSRGLYGHEMREMFGSYGDDLILGCDGAGLELRMLAHFMNDPEYTAEVLDGDIHTYNQLKAGLAKRDYAKTFIYAFLYGSGIGNLARTLGIPEATMRKVVETFKASLPSLNNLLERVKDSGTNKGYLVCLDGRRGRLRRRDGAYLVHTALNVLLQMTGSVVMKWGHIIAEDLAVERGLIKNVKDFPIIAHMHDEAQIQIKASDAKSVTYELPKEEWKSEEKAIFKDRHGNMWSAPEIVSKDEEEGLLTIRRWYHPLGGCYADGIRLAGEKLHLRCPTAGEYKIGKSWADTH